MASYLEILLAWFIIYGTYALRLLSGILSFEQKERDKANEKSIKNNK